MKKRKTPQRRVVDPFGEIGNCEPPRFLNHSSRVEWFRLLSYVPVESRSNKILGPVLCAYIAASNSIGKITKTKRSEIDKSLRTFRVLQRREGQMFIRVIRLNHKINDAMEQMGAIEEFLKMRSTVVSD